MRKCPAASTTAVASVSAAAAALTPSSAHSEPVTLVCLVISAASVSTGRFDGIARDGRAGAWLSLASGRIGMVRVTPMAQSRRGCLLRSVRAASSAVAMPGLIRERGARMTVVEGILLALSVAVFIYLGIAMFKPEWF